MKTIYYIFSFSFFLTFWIQASQVYPISTNERPYWTTYFELANPWLMKYRKTDEIKKQDLIDDIAQGLKISKHTKGRIVFVRPAHE